MEDKINGIYNALGDVIKDKISNIYIHRIDTGGRLVSHEMIRALYNRETNYYNKKYFYMAYLSLYINEKIMLNRHLLPVQQDGGKNNLTHKLNKYSYKYNTTYDHKYNIKYLEYFKKNMLYDFNYINNIINQTG
jgi:hypothetical protein